MISTKKHLILHVFFLVHLLYTSNALQCKSCEKTNPACLLADDVDTHDCPGVDDLCYSWYDRTGSKIGVQRGCISQDAREFKTLKEILGEKDNECFKRANGLDCFKLCSTDSCN